MAASGEEGLEKTLALKPDLITMDIQLPGMDGYETTRRIMAECPTPIIVVSTAVDSVESRKAFNAIRAGALDVVAKPSGSAYGDFTNIREQLVTKAKLMSEVKVIRQRVRDARTLSPLSFIFTPVGAMQAGASLAPKLPPAIVVIGASTGGPNALNALLKMLPREFPLPIIIVQHITIGFTDGLARWLQTDCPLPIKLASHGERIAAGTVYLAPDTRHLVLQSRGLLGLTQTPPVNHVRPSATVLFESVARVYGAEAIGVLLTGMGEDGALGLKSIHDQGGVTLAQNEETCVVYGMPKVAVMLGAVDAALPLPRIAPRLVELAQAQRTLEKPAASPSSP